MIKTITFTFTFRDYKNNGNPFPVRVGRQIETYDDGTWRDTYMLHGDCRALDHADIIDQLAQPPRSPDYGGAEYCLPARIVSSSPHWTRMEQVGGLNI